MYTVPIMNKILKIVIGVIILLAVIVGVKYSSQKESQVVLKMGVISPLTGDFASVGENIVKGIKTAQSVYEQETGTKVELVIENDGGDGAKGLAAYKKLTEIDHINSLINVFTTTMDTIYVPTKAAGYPIMMEAFQANNVADDHVFQMTPGNDNVWDRYAKYIANAGYDQSKVVVIHSIDAAQASFSDAFVKEYGKPATTLVASSDKNTLKTDAAKIAALKPTMVIFFMTPENGALLTKNLLPLIDSKTQLVYDIQLYTGVSFYKDQLGGDLSKINGAINLMFEGDPTTTESKEFVTAFKKLYPNEEPGFLADHGYDTFMTYVKAYDKDNSKWTDNLKKINAMGASGQIKFDHNGIRVPDLVVKKVIDGESKTVDRLAI